MAQQLRDRLNAVFSDGPWQALRGTPGVSAGDRIADVRTMVVHQTAGWPPRSNGVAMFRSHFIPPPPPPPPAPPPVADRLTTQLYVSGDGTVLQGMQLPNRTNHAGFVNIWSLGTETGHGIGN